jgi:hypothetical protein
MGGDRFVMLEGLRRAAWATSDPLAMSTTLRRPSPPPICASRFATRCAPQSAKEDRARCSPASVPRSQSSLAASGPVVSTGLVVVRGIVAFRLPSESGTVPVALLGGVLALSALAAA